MGGAWALAWLLAVTAAPPSAAVSEGDACTTPDNKPGACRLIRDCPALFALLTPRPTQQAMASLARARCGFRGSDELLCCAPGPDEPVEAPRDVSRHANVHLLPLDTCSGGLFDRIVGGKEADLYGHPYMARLGYGSRSNPSADLVYRCGGTLISSNYVLTAAHCVTNLPEDLHVVGVRLGEHTADTKVDCRGGSCLPEPLDFKVDETIVHKDFSPKDMQHDIALVRLAGNVDFQKEEFVRAVCLPVGDENQNLAFNNTKMTVAGWGTMESGVKSTVLLDVLLPSVPLQTCRAAYTKHGRPVRLTARQLCAGGDQGHDSCTGDSGGPLLHSASVNGEDKRVQFGVVSFGPRNCGTGGVPGIYTRVGYYMDWILNSMRP